jgi:NAD(P)-dependent dehydrogenase (short-subunit alcohol dehydrogenase family)
MNQLNGKIALITGGNSGIGFASAALLRQHGAQVIITGRDKERVTAAAAQLGEDVLGIVADVTDVTALRKAADWVKQRYGCLDVLFANAGVAFATQLQETTTQRFDEIMDINFKGAFFTVQAFVPLMQSGSSVILNTSWLNQVGTAGLSLLSASKAAVRSLAQTLSAELRPQGIRVNAVSPGAIATPIHGKTGMNVEQQQAFAERMMAAIPLGRFGTADDIAQAVLFLAGPQSSYMLGAELVVDGGFSQL